MRTRDVQLLTTLSLLALIGLVGGMGTGLHSWLGCYCERTFSSAQESVPSVEVASNHHSEREQPSGGSECPVCSLLLRYHATPLVVTEVTLDEAMVAWRYDGDPSSPVPSYFNWRRPRGPPSLASAS